MIIDLNHLWQSFKGNLIARSLQVKYCGLQYTVVPIEKVFKESFFHVFYDPRTQSSFLADSKCVAKKKLIRMRKKFEKEFQHNIIKEWELNHGE